MRLKLSGWNNRVRKIKGERTISKGNLIEKETINKSKEIIQGSKLSSVTTKYGWNGSRKTQSQQIDIYQ